MQVDNDADTTLIIICRVDLHSGFVIANFARTPAHTPARMHTQTPACMHTHTPARTHSHTPARELFFFYKLTSCLIYSVFHCIDNSKSLEQKHQYWSSYSIRQYTFRPIHLLLILAVQKNAQHPQLSITCLHAHNTHNQSINVLMSVHTKVILDPQICTQAKHTHMHTHALKLVTHIHMPTLSHTHCPAHTHTHKHAHHMHSLTQTYPPSHSQTHSLTHTHTLTHSLTQTHIHSLTLAHTLTHSHRLTHHHTHTLTLAHTRTHTHTHTLSQTHTQTHTHTLTLTQTLNHTDTHSHRHTLTHTHTNKRTHTGWCRHSARRAARAEDFEAVVHGGPGELGQQGSHVQLGRRQLADVGADLVQGPLLSRVKQVVEPESAKQNKNHHNTRSRPRKKLTSSRTWASEQEKQTSSQIWDGEQEKQTCSQIWDGEQEKQTSSQTWDSEQRWY